MNFDGASTPGVTRISSIQPVNPAPGVSPAPSMKFDSRRRVGSRPVTFHVPTSAASR